MPRLVAPEQRDPAAHADDDRYLTLTELVAYTGLSAGTLRRLMRHPTNPLPVYRVGTRVLVRRSEFDQWIRAAQRQQSADPIGDLARAAAARALGRRG